MLKFIFFFLVLSSYFLAQIPDWAEGIVWYQIFPERFANGDPSNDPEAEKVFINEKHIPEGWKVKEWTGSWFEQDEWEKSLGGSFRDHLYERRYGGDINGIIDKLDYLKQLGVGAIYLNPVFEAPSLHKYDGSSFHHIDVNFGPDPAGDRELIKSETPGDPRTWTWTKADSLFLKLIDEVHKREMRIIIDGVFNHTGTQFWAFLDLRKNGIDSKYRDWYIVKSFDDPSTLENEFDYKGWWGTKSLPELNRTSNDLMPGPKQYIFNSTKKWMDPDGDGDPSDGIDGWRLDVAREVPMGFWKDWSKLVKTLNPEAIIIGELWELSPDFVSEDGPFDALMNYNFAFSVNDFFIAQKNKITASEFVEKLTEVINTYPEKNLNLLQNLVDSHDTDRLSSMIKNPDRKYDRDANEETNYNPGKPDIDDYNLQKLIAAFQMTYLGAPMIYYGDEVGMWGADDPHCRKPMIWDNLQFNNEIVDDQSGFLKGFGEYPVYQLDDLLDFYKKIISIRNENNAFKRGKLKFIYSDNDRMTIAFLRSFGNEVYLSAFNLSSESVSFEATLPFSNAAYTELMNGESGIIFSELIEAQFGITVAPRSVRIYKFVISGK